MSRKNKKKENMQVADAGTVITPKFNWYREEMNMQEYHSLRPKSFIISYSEGYDFVRVQIDDSRIYRYTNKSAGKKNINKMKELAKQGRLEEFMDDEVLANLYERREV